MLTKEQLQARADEIKQQVEQSLERCNQGKAELEKMYGNHNALLGAQILANQLLQECDVTLPDTNSNMTPIDTNSNMTPIDTNEVYTEVHEAQNQDAE